MKIAITGHTKGIGKHLYDNLSFTNKVKGFSKSEVYDICKAQDRNTIIKQIKDFDIFINNAHDDFGQTKLLYELWNDWHTKPKTIISIGSNITNHALPLNMKKLFEYQMQKKTLKNLHFDLQNLNTNVIMHYVSFGYVGTEITLNEILKIIMEKLHMNMDEITLKMQAQDPAHNQSAFKGLA